ncbi:MAG: Na/Pi cotransporter family protein [Muribaculaceae bacterium]|nr:Na/Pi cotransporter family protein [Muribaculaceae bacterium]
MDYSLLDFLTLLGAVGIFLYGMTLMSEGLQKAAGNGLRNILGAMTRNRFTGALTGFSITALIQSSSASTVMVVSFVSAGLMTLAQSVAVIMGANVGTTATAWIITLFGFKVDIGAFAVPIIAFCIPLLFSSNSRRKSIGEIVLGFALLFIGLDWIEANVPDLKSSPEIFGFLSQYANMGYVSALIFVLIGIITTMIIQSSSAAIAIVLIMCTKGWITFDLACAMILGSNIGTTITPIIASLGANLAAKRAALCHLMFNVLGTIWALALFIPFTDLTVWVTEHLGQGDPTELYAAINSSTPADPTQIAIMAGWASFGLSIFHTIFNLINLSVMIWMTGFYVKVVEKIMPSKHKGDDEFQLTYISSGRVAASELNMAQAEKEIGVFAKRVSRMLDMAQNLVHTKEGSDEFNKLYSRLEKYEEISDRMEIEIANYLNRCAEGRLSNQGKQRIAAMLNIISEIESIADSCFGVAKILARKQEGHVAFNDEIYGNIDSMFAYVKKAMKNMMVLLEDLEDVREEDIIVSYNHEREINNMRNNLRVANIENINNRHYEYQAGIYYMDLIGDLERTGDYIINVVDTVKEWFRKQKHN